MCVFFQFRTHTAVKIAPRYHGPTIHVLDASKSVVVVKICIVLFLLKMVKLFLNLFLVWFLLFMSTVNII